jgi:predicted RNA binding protein YcfA (HicA-like mRNA interferase family)
VLAAGFSAVGRRGSHVKFIRRAARGDVVVIVPRQPQIAVGTLRSIVRQGGLTVEQFQRLPD